MKPTIFPFIHKNSHHGFTLVELMVALTGGLAFSVFVFALTTNVSRFFQQQTRLADATMGVVTAYQRLRADVQRTGFLSSPNFAQDPMRCPRKGGFASLLSSLPPAAGAYPLLGWVGLARIIPGGSLPLTGNTSIAAAPNNRAPDALYLFGNYTSADSYPVRGLVPGTDDIVLEQNSEELTRAGYGTGGADQAILDGLFPAGRLLRVYDPNSGEEQYAVINQTLANPGQPTVTVVGGMLQWTATGATCGIRGSGASLRINPVNIIRYSLANPVGNPDAFAGYAGYALLNDGVGDINQRTDLMREEIDPATATVMQTTQPDGSIRFETELAAEFAVDFQVDIIAVTNQATGATSELTSADANYLFFAGDPALPADGAAAGRGPHLMRALHPRLGVRERLPSREVDIAGAAPGFYRFNLNPGGTPPEFARVRTLQSHIMTRNSRNVLW